MQASIIDRPCRAQLRDAPFRFVFPDLNEALPRPDEPAAPDEALPAPDLVFSEQDLARAAAALRAASAHEARADAERLVEARLHVAVSSLDERVAALAAHREHDMALVKLTVRRLFGLFARACLDAVAGSHLADAMARAVERVLAQVPQAGCATVEVAPALLEPMRALLDARAGAGPGRHLSVVARPDLAPGDVLMSWPDGWAEWSFDQLGESLRRELDSAVRPAEGSAGPSLEQPAADHARPECPT